MTPLAAEAAYYREVDAAHDRDVWIDNRVAELMADEAELVETMSDCDLEIRAAITKLLTCAPYEIGEYAGDLVDFIRARYEKRAANEWRKG